MFMNSRALRIEWGDCDPAGIVFFPNYSRWMDAASHHFFVRCGLPPWRAMAELPGCVHLKSTGLSASTGVQGRAD